MEVGSEIVPIGWDRVGPGGAPRLLRDNGAFPDTIRSHGKGYVVDTVEIRGNGVVEGRVFVAKSCRLRRTGLYPGKRIVVP